MKNIIDELIEMELRVTQRFQSVPLPERLKIAAILILVKEARESKEMRMEPECTVEHGKGER